MRVQIASLRGVLPRVPYASGYEFEDIIESFGDADVVPLSPRLSLIKRAASRQVKSDVDLFFTHIMDPSDLEIVKDQIPRNVPHKAIWIEEFWPHALQNHKHLRMLQEFNHIFLGHQATVAPLEKLIGKPCTFLPFAVDALGFCPWPNPPARSIDFLSVGRRRDDLHSQLYEAACQDNDFYYVFDTTRRMPFNTPDGHKPHRMQLASQIKRTRFFLADRAKLDKPEQTDGSQVYGPRFFEGAAGGAILIGVPPDCDHFRADFDWDDAVLPLPVGADAREIMETFSADPERVTRARRNNVLGMLEKHDWAHRWRRVLDTLGLELPAGLGARLETLAERADLVRQNPGPQEPEHRPRPLRQADPFPRHHEPLPSRP